MIFHIPKIITNLQTRTILDEVVERALNQIFAGPEPSQYVESFNT